MTEPQPAVPAEPPIALRRTPLFDFHVAHHAKMVPFNGWEMPLYYSGILEEHRAVRGSVGFFDVGHMGIVTVSGGHAADLLSRRTTANVGRVEPGQCRYTFLLDFTGVIVDDLLITRLDAGAPDPNQFLAVPNAGRAAKIVELLTEHRRPDTPVGVHNGPVTIVAVQGPNARSLLEKEFGWSLANLKFYHAAYFPLGPGGTVPTTGRIGERFPAAIGPDVLVSRTGYTGELGYELFLPGAAAPAIAEKLLAAGAHPCGLGARDTLRLEKGYLLSGQDFNRDHTPLEAGQEKFIDFDHPFVGREILEGQRKEGLKLRLAGLRTERPDAIPRHGSPVFHGDEAVGTVTSGGLSPTLGYGIALAYLLPALGNPGTRLSIDLRGRRAPAEVVTLPFLAASSGRRGNTTAAP